MPQVFEVLRCFKCFVFQVHQTKKANKFVCKMCGEKQSIKRNYGLGTGQECRVHVQKLNGIRRELDESKSFEENPTNDEEENSVPSVTEVPRKIESKWAGYAKSNENVDTTNLTDGKMFLNNTEVVLEVPKKKRQRRSIVNYKNNTSNTKLEMVDDTDTECQETSCNLEMNVLSEQNPFCRSTRQGELFAQAETNNRYSQKINLIDEALEFKSKDSNLTLKNYSNALNQKKTQQSFVPPVVKTNSKWFQFTETDLSIAQNKIIPEINSVSNNTESQFSSYSDHDSAESDNSNTENENYNECISNSIDKNSQCLRLTEDRHRNTSGENKKQFALETIPKLQNDPHSLFSLCDDSDIDNLLDI